MRFLLEDCGFTATQAINGEILQVNLPQNANRCDLWFWLNADNDPAVHDIYVYLTRAEARAAATADDPGTNYVASITALNPALPELTFTDNAAVPPDLTGLTIIPNFPISAHGVTLHTVWGYTCAPDLVVAQNIRDILTLHTNAGQALADFGFSTADQFAVGMVGDAKYRPFIAIIPRPGELQFSEHGGLFNRMRIPITVEIASAFFESIEDSWVQARRYQAALESILFDEYRTSYGETKFSRQSVNGPEAVDLSTGPEMRTAVNLLADFPVVWRDDVYPRL
jgi:hypothetical protein